MSREFKRPPQKARKKHQPKGFDILHEDLDLIVGNKAAGYLTVAALWNKDETIHSALNRYVRKGNAKSKKCVYVVHRLDQATTGVLVFAKTVEVQEFLKDNWQTNEKIYLAVVHGKPAQRSGLITSYLSEDEDYTVHSNQDSANGKLAKTQYEVIAENDRFSLLRINLITGRKNQIRVHLAELGTPVVGDAKYGRRESKFKQLALHSHSITLTHPFSKKRMTFTAPVPDHFNRLVEFEY